MADRDMAMACLSTAEEGQLPSWAFAAKRRAGCPWSCGPLSQATGTHMPRCKPGGRMADVGTSSAAKTPVWCVLRRNVMQCAAMPCMRRRSSSRPHRCAWCWPRSLVAATPVRNTTRCRSELMLAPRCDAVRRAALAWPAELGYRAGD